MESTSPLLQRNRAHDILLRGVLTDMYGDRTPCVAYSNPKLQNLFWEGFTQSNKATNLFAWDFNEGYIHAAVNYPGSLNDSKIAAASVLYKDKLIEGTPAGFAVLCDCTFRPSDPDLRGKIVGARKNNQRGETSDIPRSSFCAAIDLLLEKSNAQRTTKCRVGCPSTKRTFWALDCGCSLWFPRKITYITYISPPLQLSKKIWGEKPNSNYQSW